LEKIKFMSENHLTYPLKNGYIHNWLVAGPQATPIPALEHSKEDGTVDLTRITRQFYKEQADLSGQPVDRGESEVGGEKITWNYLRCHEDHFVDVSNFYSTWQHLQTWAYTEIKARSPIPVKIVLTTLGPVDIWLNGKLIHRQESFSRIPVSTHFQTSLELENTLLVRFEQVGVRECENVMAFQIVELPSEEDEQAISISVPTNARYPLRQQALEQTFEMAYLEEVVNHRGTHINLRWAEDSKEGIAYAFKIKDALHYVYVDGNWRTDPAKPFNVGHIGRLRERSYYVTLEAPLKEFFEHNLRYQRHLPIHVLDDAYSNTPYHDLAQRRLEALESATKYENNLYSEIAKMELNRWPDLNPGLIMKAVDQVNQRTNDSDIFLVGLMGILYRYKNNPAFPKNLERPIEECVLNFKYWLDEPGDDALDFTSESHSILFHTCEILAGQLYPTRIFSTSHKAGSWHRRKAGQLALDWMRQRGSCGFLEWDSNCYYEQVVFSLSYLTSLAKDDSVHELAAVLLDKILFTLAVNSFKGVFGSTHGRTHASMIKSAQLEATSGINRFLWGLGVFNHHILGTVGLACSNYEYPAFFADIATDMPEEIWNKERHVIIPSGGEVSSPGEGEVNTVTYKTPDTMLSSAQDYRPGGRGSQEHIWQATMGPDAVVFTSHPACISESDAHHPGFWLGNAVLPRAAQWKDVLFAVYNFTEPDWLGFTHAYFPIYAFDEHAFQAGWAFARKGKGYLALAAARGFELIKCGPDGYRELRSYGHQNIWVCQMGREAKDGAFSDFQKKILELRLSFQDLAVQMTSLRGEELLFGWQGPLMINGIEQPISGFKHIENPYCTADLDARHLDISHDGFLLRLNFE
jgi:hypothetical protein